MAGRGRPKSGAHLEHICEVDPNNVMLLSIGKFCSEVKTRKQKGIVKIEKNEKANMSNRDIAAWEKWRRGLVEAANQTDTSEVDEETAKTIARITDDETPKEFDAEWGMSIDETEKEYLNNYLNRLKREKDLSSIAALDMGKKMAKYSLMANQAMEKYRLGVISLSELNETQKAFEALSKTANFAPSKNTGGTLSISEIALYIEEHSQPLLIPRKFEKDDIDEVIEQFRNIIQATSQNI